MAIFVHTYDQQDHKSRLCGACTNAVHQNALGTSWFVEEIEGQHCIGKHGMAWLNYCYCVLGCVRWEGGVETVSRQTVTLKRLQPQKRWRWGWHSFWKPKRWKFLIFSQCFWRKRCVRHRKCSINRWNVKKNWQEAIFLRLAIGKTQPKSTEFLVL